MTDDTSDDPEMATDAPARTEAEPAGTHDAFLRWVIGQPGWMRSLARVVAASDEPVHREAVAAAFYEFLLEHGLASGPRRNDSSDSADAPGTEPEHGFRLEQLLHVGGVNALLPDQVIPFNEHLTVIYGENGSGKSGYVRIIKSAAEARSVEPIEPDLRSPHKGEPAPVPTAVFQLKAQEASYSVRWRGRAIPALGQLAVFDARAAPLHLDDDLRFRYVPRNLRLFRSLYTVLEMLRGALHALRSSLPTPTNELLGLVPAGTAAYRFLSSLSLTTSTNATDVFAPKASDREQRAALERELDSLRAADPEPQKIFLRDEAQFHLLLLDALGRIEAFDVSDYERARTALASAEDGLRASGAAALSGDAIPLLLTPEWERLIQAADEYSQAVAETDVDVPSRCPYCRQQLSDSAIQLVARYREHCSNAARAALEERAALFDETIDGIGAINADDLLRRAADRREHGRQELPVAVAVGQILASLQALQEALRARAPEAQVRALTSWTHEDVARYVAALAATRDANARMLSSMNEASTDRDGQMTAIQASLAELNANELVYANAERVAGYVRGLMWQAGAEKADADITRRLRAITAETTRAGDAAMNSGFSKLFEEECQALDAPNVELHFPGRRGELARTKQLFHTAQPRRVLSEAEQKVLALADFLAEVRLREHPAPIVLDDPVTSMDGRRLEQIAERISALAEERQVIVFTHSIWFLGEISMRYKKRSEGVTYVHLRRQHNGAGSSTRGKSPVRTCSEREQEVRGYISRATLEPAGEEQSRFVRDGYRELRELCEAVVEQRLLRDAIKRHRPNVLMDNLQDIDVDTLKEGIKTALTVFGRASRRAAHSQPEETGALDPLPAELERDLTLLKQIGWK